ncbi:MAG: M36 family metallopeptidase [Pyrinomonadaceae bacterium]
MLRQFSVATRRILVLACALSAGFAAVFLFILDAKTDASSLSTNQKRQVEARLPNYDIRLEKNSGDSLARFRGRSGRNLAQIAELRATMLAGEQSLRQRIPTLKIEYNDAFPAPEVITTDVKQGKAFLTSGAAGKRSSLLKRFLTENVSLIGTDLLEIAKLKVTADYRNPDGELSFVELTQRVNGIPVFRGEVKAGFTRDGELIRVVNNLAPGIDAATLSQDFGDSANAVASALTSLGAGEVRNPARNDSESTDLKSVFGDGDAATTAEKMYFPTEPGVTVPAWRVLIWQPVNAYYVVVDAADGVILWRKNITEDQTQPATYSVYANPSAMMNVADNPFAFSPGPTSPNGSQGVALNRMAVSRIGNEAPYTFNNLGWITDGGTTTDGNAVQAGIDRDGIDGIDALGEAISPTRDFTFAYTPVDPNTNTGDNPVASPQTYPGSQFQQGILTNLFYVSNWFHDETYRLGFTEAARNFQNTNFSGQGIGSDRLRAEGQDAVDTNNANFSTPADGTRGRMQMFIFTGANPDVDASLDSSVVIHELTHGLSNRLHGNSFGLVNDMSRGIGEGTSDFYALAMLSQASDPADGNYAVAGYATYLSGGSTNNNYYGIRRFPTAIRSAVGGSGNNSHNPLTFADIDSTKINLTNGAYAPRNNNTSDQVHNAGEIWSSMLWEVRARMISRLGWETGNRRMLQLVTDGMKLAPLSPTFIGERDAIIAAAYASGDAADVADLWAGFALRGLGAGATIENIGGISIGGTGRARVTEAFGLPNLTQDPGISVDDFVGDGDGYPEPGETVTLSIPIKNSTGSVASGVSVQIAGGGLANVGTLGGAAAATATTTLTLPASPACGGVTAVTISVNSSLGPVSFTRQLLMGKPSGPLTTSENFDGVTAPVFPAGWTATSVSDGISFVTSTNSPDTAPNTVFALDPTTIGGGTDLISPLVSVTAADATVSFRNHYDTELGWDGGVLEVSVAGAPFQDFLAAGGTFMQNGYNGSLGPGTNNPIANRAAWTGDSSGYVTTVARLPATANGKIVQFKWRFGADNNTAEMGWRIDTFQLTGAGFFSGLACNAGVQVSGKVTTSDGRGIGNTVVTMTDSAGVTQRVTTTPFGFYTIGNIASGGTYTLRAISRRYRFAAVAINLSDRVSDLNFIAQE